VEVAPALRVESTEGCSGDAYDNLELDASPSLISIGVERVRARILPLATREPERTVVVIRGHAPLDTFWEEARRLAVPADLEVMDARIEYTDTSRGKVFADNVRSSGALGAITFMSSRSAPFGTTFVTCTSGLATKYGPRDSFARETEDPKAPTLKRHAQSGEGVEWALEHPESAFSEWANRIGLRFDETWAEAVFVGIGSLIVPDSPALSARADFRFTVDHWHLPSWPEGAALDRRSGAVALRISPGLALRIRSRARRSQRVCLHWSATDSFRSASEPSDVRRAGRAELCAPARALASI